VGRDGPMMLLPGCMMHEKIILSRFCNSARKQGFLLIELRVPETQAFYALYSILCARKVNLPG